MASFPLFCFAFLALISQHILVDADVIAATCGKTKLKDLCQSIFAAHPDSKNADLYGLANIAFDAAIKQAKDIQLKTQELSKSSDGKGTQKLLNDCSELYREAIVGFEASKESLKSKEALKPKDYLRINLWVLLAIQNGQTCESGFTESPSGASPLTQMNKQYEDICSIILTIEMELSGV